jgi:hypothetical protein
MAVPTANRQEFGRKETFESSFPLAIAAIRRMGMRTVLLTGDATSIAEEVGSRLRVDEVRAELLPEQKLAKVCEPSQACGGPSDCSPMPQHHLAELRGNPARRWVRHRARGIRFPEPAARSFVHVSSELLFILNSMRLLPGRPR